MPSMPTISEPTLSSPTISNPTTSGTSSSQSTNKSEGAKSSTNTSKSTTSKTSSKSTTTAAGLTAANLLGLSGGASGDLLSSLLNTTGNSSLATGTNAISGMANPASTTLLNEIVKKLETLQKTVDSMNGTTASSTTKTTKTTNTASTSTTSTTNKMLASSDKGRVVRFRINGYDILNSLTAVYFSDRNDDGSFIFTADRTYTADRTTKQETVYMLFSHPAKTSPHYEIASTVMQDTENRNSFLYRFSEQSPLSARLTGNTITMLSNKQNFKCELVIELK